VTSSGAASGYSVVQNLLSSFDNITINNGGSSAPSPLPSGGGPLAAVDALIASPKVNVSA